MPKVLLPSKPDQTPPKECVGKRVAVNRGSYYEFELSMEEFKFWKAIANEEREKLRVESFNRCFYDVLREYMQNNPRKITNIFGRGS
jgi:hypothetical protein